jgi:diguanylate cyclase (GGDEF)-like protein
MAATEKEPLSEPHAGNARVLITDDSRVIRQAIRKILRSDFDVVLAEAGESAWAQILEDSHIKALITDIEMPGVDGYELMCRIRAADDPRIRDLPIIAITGAEDEQTKQRALACGATDFITKPIDSIQLHARVSAYVKFDETTRQLTEKSVALEKQLVTDPLTDLHSRRYFMDRAEQDIAYSVRRDRDLSVIRLDIDKFKRIYQQYGDEVSDHILVWLANIIRTTARTEDTIARVGGAEIAILANSANISDSKALCNRLRSAVNAHPFAQGNTKIEISISIGLASLAQDRQQEIDKLFVLAEQRLAHAKSEGGNRVCSTIMEGAESAVEEVVLTEPISAESSTSGADPVTENLSVAELEGIVKQETGQGKSSPPVQHPHSQRAHGGGERPQGGELVSVDRALQLLARGDGAALEPYLDNLIDQIKPLVDFYYEKKNKRSDSASES